MPEAGPRLELAPLIAEVEAFARESGLSVATVCDRATGNSRLIDRMRRSDARLREYAAKLRRFMDDARRGKGRAE